MDQYQRLLRVTRLLVEPLVQRLIEALRQPQGSRGLDVGCGLGSQTMLLAMAVGSRAKDELSPEDRELFQHLCEPESPGSVLDAADYCGFYTYTLFQGVAPA